MSKGLHMTKCIDLTKAKHKHVFIQPWFLFQAVNTRLIKTSDDEEDLFRTFIQHLYVNSLSYLEYILRGKMYIWTVSYVVKRQLLNCQLIHKLHDVAIF